MSPYFDLVHHNICKPLCNVADVSKVFTTGTGAILRLKQRRFLRFHNIPTIKPPLNRPALLRSESLYLPLYLFGVRIQAIEKKEKDLEEMVKGNIVKHLREKKMMVIRIGKLFK